MDLEETGTAAPAGAAGREGVWEARGALAAWVEAAKARDCMCKRGITTPAAQAVLLLFGVASAAAEELLP